MSAGQGATLSRLCGVHFVQQLKEAAAYGSYMLFTVFLPNAVNVVTLYYGGTLVLDDRMSAGALVSFMLYVASLNGAFQARPQAYPYCSPCACLSRQWGVRCCALGGCIRSRSRVHVQSAFCQQHVLDVVIL